MRVTRVMLLLLLTVGFAACKPAAQKLDPAALIREANSLLQAGNKTDELWSREYQKAFAPQSRAQFPANCEALRAHADSITKLLDENSAQCNKALAKYDEAMTLIKNEQQRRGMSLLVSALRKSLEMNEVFKSQMQLVSDERIVDAKTFDEKFKQGLKRIPQIQSERQTQFDEGRRLLGM